MNLGVALAVLSLGQLGLAWAADKTLDRLYKPLVTEQLRNYRSLGVSAYFSQAEPNDPGSARIAVVLSVTRLASNARATVVALVVGFASLVVVAILVWFGDPPPNLKALRLIVTVAVAVGTGAATFLLLVKLAAREVVAVPHGSPDGGAVKRFLALLRRSEALARYVAVAVVADVVAIVAALEL